MAPNKNVSVTTEELGSLESPAEGKDCKPTVTGRDASWKSFIFSLPTEVKKRHPGESLQNRILEALHQRGPNSPAVCA